MINLHIEQHSRKLATVTQQDLASTRGNSRLTQEINFYDFFLFVFFYQKEKKWKYIKLIQIKSKKIKVF